jgi:PAS domain S-box-containing protein
MPELHTATILYVDDDPDNRSTFRWIFERAGYGFREAATGGEALQRIADKPDLVVLDVNLPDIDGFEVCKRIKAHPATTGIPVLHLSAVYVTPQDRTHGLEEGADAYLTKPVEPDELIAHVHALLRVHQAEEKARTEAHHWQATFDAISDGVCLLDAQGTVLRCNRALGRLVGRPVEQLLGVSYRDLTPAPVGEPLVLPFATMLANGRGEAAEIHLGGRWLHVSADPLIEAGTVTGAVYQLSDITARKRLEEQLRQAQKMEAVGQLAGGIAHDFNNLLTAITGNVSLLLTAARPGEAQHHLLEATNKAAWRAAELVRQLLSFSRKAVLWMTATDLNQSVGEALEILRRAIDPRVTLETRLAPDLWQVQADPGQIIQVLMNLCLNARDAMPEGGRLTLTTENVAVGEEHTRHHLEARPGPHVRLRIADTGHGITPALLPFIFDPFFTTKPVGQGSGLGLATAFGIVKQHQGWIECSSTVGEGTTFDVYLPSQAARARAAVSAPAPPTPPAGGRETVLLVDDDAAVRSVGTLILERFGYEVLQAEDGLKALEIYQRDPGRVKLVILDLTMPRLSGLDTFKQLLQLDPAARVLLASGFSSEHVSAEERQQAAGFVGKPYRVEVLARAVRDALDATVGRGA